MEYRSDLTGLRAFAVAAVVLFHFGVDGFGGGFAGVDVFFVISGYLMTRIVVEGLASGKFSFAQFYRSRAKRIVPALVALGVVLMLIGLFVLGSRDYYALSKHIAASVLFVSNFVYRNEAGYFDADSHEKWMLHTWSLSVEWQFYLLYPLVLAGIARFWAPRGHGFRIVLWLLAAASLAASTWAAEMRPVDGFFLLPARAWELLAGGLIYLHAGGLKGRVPRRSAEIAGLALIGFSFVTMSESVPWPGYAALLPVLGTCLILLAEPRSYWLGNPISQAVGKWSYSIYLWHWPLYVGSRYFDWPRTFSVDGALMGMSVVLGYLSYRFVEEPCRHSGFARSLDGRRIAWMVTPVLLLCAVGLVTNGLPTRLPDAIVAIEKDPSHVRGNPVALCDERKELESLSVCLMGDPAMAPTVAVLGDSHAGALLPAIRDVAKESGIRAMALPSAACPPIEGVQRIAGIPGDGCRRYVEASRAVLEASSTIQTVILIARWSAYVEGYSERTGGPYAIFEQSLEDAGSRRTVYRRRLVASLCDMSRRHVVYAMLPVPEQGRHVPREMVRQLITRSIPEFPQVSPGRV